MKEIEPNKDITKSEITKELKKLELLGWKLYTANSNRYMPTGLDGFPDHMMIHSWKGIVYTEVKLRKDSLNEKQKRTREMLTAITGWGGNVVKYFIITEKNYIDIINGIINL